MTALLQKASFPKRFLKKEKAETIFFNSPRVKILSTRVSNKLVDRYATMILRDVKTTDFSLLNMKTIEDFRFLIKEEILLDE